MLCRILTFFAVLATFRSVTSGPTSRIVGGDDANIGQFPHQVSLQRDDASHTCGGTIISERYILTAAHCVVAGNGIEPFPARYFQVRVGSIQRNAAGKLVGVKRIIVNTAYRNFMNDIALIELQQPLQFTENIQPIQLADEEVPPGAEVIVSGWGRLYQNGPIPHRLQWTKLTVLSDQECDERIYSGHESMICLDHPVNNGVCNGDSGGPAIWKGKVVGVANWVYGGCGTSNPDGYAKVKFFTEWIHENMK